jgi:hypothetical protein
LFPPSFLHHCSKRPHYLHKMFLSALRVHGAYMSARVNYHLPGNILFFFFFPARPLSGYIQCGKCWIWTPKAIESRIFFPIVLCSQTGDCPCKKI